MFKKLLYRIWKNIVVGQNMRRLVKKKGTMVTNPMAASSGNISDSGATSNYGLRAFVEEKEFCPFEESILILAKCERYSIFEMFQIKLAKKQSTLQV